MNTTTIKNDTIDSIPVGWNIVENQGGISMFQEGSNQTYIIAVDLSTGAKVVPYFELAAGNTNATETNPSPSFNKKVVNDFDTDLESRFGLVNLSFFGYVDQSAFIVRKNNTLISAGYGTFSATEGPRRTLTITYPTATVYEGPEESEGNYYDLASQLYADSTHALTGLHPLNADKGKDNATPRTFVGIKQQGLSTIVYTLTCEALTQQQAYDVLINFGCKGSNIVMFDGGGSTQMKIMNKMIITSSDNRPVPIFLVFKEQ